MSEREVEVYRLHREVQQKYVYFLLAAAGACVGFSLTQTKGMPLSLELLPIGVAVALWGASFYFGCRQIQALDVALAINFQQLVSKGKGLTDSSYSQAALRKQSEMSKRMVKRQLGFFIVAAFFYVVGHIWVMWLSAHP